MIIKVKEQFITCENNIEKITDSIDEILNRENEIGIDFIVDGITIKEDSGIYLTERLAVTKEIEVITLTVQQLVQDTINSAFTYLKNGTPHIRRMASEFEMEPSAITWQSLNELF